MQGGRLLFWAETGKGVERACVTDHLLGTRHKHPGPAPWAVAPRPLFLFGKFLALISRTGGGDRVGGEAQLTQTPG